MEKCKSTENLILSIILEFRDYLKKSDMYATWCYCHQGSSVNGNSRICQTSCITDLACGLFSLQPCCYCALSHTVLQSLHHPSVQPEEISFHLWIIVSLCASQGMLLQCYWHSDPEKIKMSLGLIKCYALKTYEVVENTSKHS